MSEKIEILALGIDFVNDYTQISYVQKNTTGEPESYSVINGEQRYLIPTVMYLDKMGRVLIGDEAIHVAKANDELESVERNIPSAILGMNKEEATNILLKYFGALLKIFCEELEVAKIHEIAVSIELPDKKIIDAIYSALFEMGYSRENIRVIDHAEAFIYYTINQKPELWINEVALFDFSEEHFIFRRLKAIKNKVPKVIRVEDTNFSDIIDYSMISSQEGQMRADAKFFQIIQECFNKSIVSTVFLTGTGFNNEWAKESINELCNKRRVFMGHNLFVKGSAYSALKKYNKQHSEYMLDCVGRTKVNVNLLIVHEGKNMSLTLSKAGISWYEAGAQVECIPDNINRIQLVFTEPMSMISKTYSIELSGLPDRPNKMTRIRISLAYLDDVNCVVQINDLGFGEFYKASEAIIRREIDIEKLF